MTSQQRPQPRTRPSHPKAVALDLNLIKWDASGFRAASGPYADHRALPCPEHSTLSTRPVTWHKLRFCRVSLRFDSGSNCLVQCNSLPKRLSGGFGWRALSLKIMPVAPQPLSWAVTGLAQQHNPESKAHEACNAGSGTWGI